MKYLFTLLIVAITFVFSTQNSFALNHTSFEGLTKESSIEDVEKMLDKEIKVINNKKINLNKENILVNLKKANKSVAEARSILSGAISERYKIALEYVKILAEEFPTVSKKRKVEILETVRKAKMTEEFLAERFKVKE
jgi:formate dehydrogenase maturation protein FdhE